MSIGTIVLIILIILLLGGFSGVGGGPWYGAGYYDATLAARPEVDRSPVAPFEDGLELLVRFEGGAVGKLLHAWSVTNRLAGLALSKIYGTEGNITFESNGLFALVTGRRAVTVDGEKFNHFHFIFPFTF